jgi:hypothetical protein
MTTKSGRAALGHLPTALPQLTGGPENHPHPSIDADLLNAPEHGSQWRNIVRRGTEVTSILRFGKGWLVMVGDEVFGEDGETAQTAVTLTYVPDSLSGYDPARDGF